MRIIINSRNIALLIACVIALVAVADAHAYYFIVIPILALDAGLTYANALSKNDPNIVTGVAGLALGSVIALSGAIGLSQTEEPWQFGISAGLGALGVASVVYGWRVIRSSRQQEDAAQYGRNMRLMPILSFDDRSERQFGWVLKVSF
jgi:hypothetical protein